MYVNMDTMMVQLSMEGKIGGSLLQAFSLTSKEKFEVTMEGNVVSTLDCENASGTLVSSMCRSVLSEDEKWVNGCFVMGGVSFEVMVQLDLLALNGGVEVGKMKENLEEELMEGIELRMVKATRNVIVEIDGKKADGEMSAPAMPRSPRNAGKFGASERLEIF